MHGDGGRLQRGHLLEPRLASSPRVVHPGTRRFEVARETTPERRDGIAASHGSTDGRFESMDEGLELRPSNRRMVEVSGPPSRVVTRSPGGLRAHLFGPALVFRGAHRRLGLGEAALDVRSGIGNGGFDPESLRTRARGRLAVREARRAITLG
ncbi:MAG TPA: hypothetical protein VII82_09965, partial [Polyangiaceae bacterium]